MITEDNIYEAYKDDMLIALAKELLKERDEALKKVEELNKENLHLKNEYSDNEIDLWNKAIKERDAYREVAIDLSAVLHFSKIEASVSVDAEAQEIMAGRGGEK